MRLSSRFAMAALTLAVLSPIVQAQDTRTVTEPVFPPTCTVLSAQLAIVSNGPASETAFDTTRLQSALNACPSGQAVELVTSGSNAAFLTKSIDIPSGVTLLVDGGVTVFASRNPADYQTSSHSATCGVFGPHTTGCNDFITINKGVTSSGSGIMGYGIIDFRGNAPMLVNGVDSVNWWNQDNAPGAPSDGNRNAPDLIEPENANNFTLYKITLMNAGFHHIVWNGDGLTVWGIKIKAPYNSPNTDGVDPDGNNITITKSFISDGDDNIAVSADDFSSNITISQIATYTGHGISIGSPTTGGLNHMLVTDILQSGNSADTSQNGLRVKSAPDRGGLVQNVTFQNVCMQNIHYPIRVYPFYNNYTGTSIPQFTNITFRNIHSITEGKLQLAGYDQTHITTMTLDNFVFDGLQSKDLSPDEEYIAFTLGPGPVTPSFLQTHNSGTTGVSYTGSVTNPTQAPYPCTVNSFQYLNGELYLSTATATNLSTLNTALPGTFTLNAMVQTALSNTSNTSLGDGTTSTGAPFPSASVQFYEGITQVGSAALGANGTLASLTLTNVAAGTHTYTAKYPGDSNYAAYTFGSVTVTVSGLLSTSTALTAPSTAAYGTSTTLTATVTTSTGAPTGTIKFMDGSTVLSTVNLTGSTATLQTTLGGGAHSLTATYNGDSSYATSTSSAATVAITPAASTTGLGAAPATITINGSSTLTATVTGLSGLAVPAGSIVFYDGTTSLNTGTLDGAAKASYSYAIHTAGSHSLTATYSGDTNYASSQGSATATVNGYATTTTLSSNPATTALAGSNITLTTTVTSGTGTPTGSVTFLNGSISLGSGTLAGGIATLTVASGPAGTDVFTASFPANSTYAASTSNTVSVAVTNIATTTTLAPVTASPYAGSNITLTATVASSSGTPVGAVNFANGVTALGSATMVSGVATLSVPVGATGTDSFTATYTANGNYAGSVSASLPVTVVSPFVITPATNTLSLAPGAAGTISLSAAPATGFTGLITYSCTTSIHYVTCTVSPSTGSTTVATIAVAATVSKLALPGLRLAGWLAVMLPLGLLGWNRRRGLSVGVSVILLLALGLAGCGSGSGGASSQASAPPAGSQSATVTASTTVNGITSTQNIPLTVNVTH